MSEGIIRDGEWFAESMIMWPGQQMSLKINKLLLQKQSKYQDICVFDSTDYGRVLALDGAIQATERDEFAYSEMIAHIPLTSCTAPPKRVLIIGGGDCFLAREVLRHSVVDQVLLCDIDSEVTQVCKKFFSNLGVFEDPRLTIVHEDGFQLLLRMKRSFDVIIVDSSDPVGPAASLYEDKFLELAYNALEPNHGVLCFQGECIWLHLEFIHNIMANAGKRFPVVDYAYTTIPTYPSGQIGFVLASRGESTSFKTPVRMIPGGSLRYYSPEIHAASFVLPVFAENALKAVRKLPSMYAPCLKTAALISTGLAVCVSVLYRMK